MDDVRVRGRPALEGCRPMINLPSDPARPAIDAASPAIDEAWTHRDDLVLYARRLLGAHGELAEDVVQDAFLRLHERVASGQGVRESRPWLFRVTRNLALDERRRTRRGEAVQSSLEVVAARPPGPQEVLLGREDARQALEGIDALPPRERDTVILDQAGLAPPAIARRMQTTTNAVHQSLFRARRRMRDARAAAWGLVPLPLIRLALRAAGSPALEGIPALAPGSGGRLAGGAGLVGLVAAAVIGGGAVVEHPVIPHTGHARHASPSAGVSVTPGHPLPASVSTTAGSAQATETALASGAPATAAAGPGVTPVRAAGRDVVTIRFAPPRRAPGADVARVPVPTVAREVEDGPAEQRSRTTRRARQAAESPESEDSTGSGSDSGSGSGSGYHRSSGDGSGSRGVSGQGTSGAEDSPDGSPATAPPPPSDQTAPSEDPEDPTASLSSSSPPAPETTSTSPSYTGTAPQETP